MIKDCYISEIQATNEENSRILYMEIDDDKVSVNLNARLTIDEFEECVVYIRKGFGFLGKSIEVSES